MLDYTKVICNIKIKWTCPHRNNTFLLHPARRVMQVNKLHCHLVVDREQELLPLPQLGLQILTFLLWQFWTSCPKWKDTPDYSICAIFVISKPTVIHIKNYICVSKQPFIHLLICSGFSHQAARPAGNKSGRSCAWSSAGPSYGTWFPPCPQVPVRHPCTDRCHTVRQLTSR